MADHFTAATETLHAQYGAALLQALGENSPFEASECPVETVQRHLNCIEGKIVREHPEMDGWILVSGESNIPDFARLFGGDQRLGRPVLTKDQVRIVVIDDFVDLLAKDRDDLFVSGEATARAFESPSPCLCRACRPWTSGKCDFVFL